MATERQHPPRPVSDRYEPPRRVSHEEYLRLDEALPGKYEYHDGWMYPRYYPPGSHWAMAGGTAAHAQIIVRFLTVLSTHLGLQGPCRVYPSDMKLTAHGHDYYPDAFVSCGEMAPNQTRIEDAVLVCEVRSQSTAGFDTGEKFDAYTHVPGLREYLIFDNRRPQATLIVRGDDGVWSDLDFSAGSTVPLTSIGLSLPIDLMYAGITLDPDPGE